MSPWEKVDVGGEGSLGSLGDGFGKGKHIMHTLLVDLHHLLIS